jgi:hypothetical protein
MQIDKDMIVNLLRDRGDEQQAEQAREELPEKVDHEKDANLLERFGVNPMDVVGKLGGKGGMFGG